MSTIATANNVVNWLDVALSGTPVVNIGQLSKSDVQSLNQAAKRGALVKGKGFWWATLGPLKTWWYLEGFEPQGVLCHLYMQEKTT